IRTAASALAFVLAYAGRGGSAFGLSGIGPLGLVATLFTSLYPRVLVSNPDFGNSLTVSGAASTHYTLAVLSVVALICLPVILVYQAWTYHVFRARVGGEELPSGPASTASATTTTA